VAVVAAQFSDIQCAVWSGRNLLTLWRQCSTL